MYAEIVLKSSKADTAFGYSKIYLTEFEIMITDGVFMDRIDKINYYLDIVSVRNATFPVASVTNFAEAFTPRRTLLFMHQENR